MQLVTAKCPDCGADLKIPDGALNVTCEYCGSHILVTDVLGSGAIAQNCMTLAYASLKGENYEDAYENFNKALEQSSLNYSAWFGKAICAGMLSRIINERFDEMIVLFESAFTNAPADKQANLRKSAAAEIVKAVSAQRGKLNTVEQLLSSFGDMGSTSINFGNLGGHSGKAKEEILRALAKAHEYDPSNNDVAQLQTEFTEGVHINAPVQTGHIESLLSEPKPTSMFQQYPTVEQINQANPKKKSGCTAMAIAAVIVIFAVGLIIYFASRPSISIKKNTDDPVKTTDQKQEKAPEVFQYSVAKVTDSKGITYIAIFANTANDDNLNSINDDVLKDYKGRDVIVNIYQFKKDAQKNGAVQINHEPDWIVKNADNMNLIATSEFLTSKNEKQFYKYVNGAVVIIMQK